MPAVLSQTCPTGAVCQVPRWEPGSPYPGSNPLPAAAEEGVSLDSQAARLDRCFQSVLAGSSSHFMMIQNCGSDYIYTQVKWQLVWNKILWCSCSITRHRSGLKHLCWKQSINLTWKERSNFCNIRDTLIPLFHSSFSFQVKKNSGHAIQFLHVNTEVVVLL